MKKILLTAIVAMAAIPAIQAQEINFVRNGEILESGKTYDWNDCLHLLDEYDGEVEYQYNTGLFLRADQDVEGVIVTAESLTPDMPVQFCYGSCTTDKSVTYDNIKVEAGKDTDLAIESATLFLKATDPVPDFSCRVIASLPGDEANARQVTINMTNGLGAVQAVVADYGFNYAGGMLNYRGMKDARLRICDLSGKTVLRAALDGDGAISASSLTPGLYIYSITGATRKSGKLVIR